MTVAVHWKIYASVYLVMRKVVHRQKIQRLWVEYSHQLLVQMNQATAVIHIIASMAKTVLVQIVCKNATRPVWDSWKLAEKLMEKLDVYAKNGTQMTVHYVRALKIKKL